MTSPQMHADALVGVDEHVHRALGVAARRLAANAGDDLLGVDELEVEQPQRAAVVVQAVDEVLDVAAPDTARPSAPTPSTRARGG